MGVILALFIFQQSYEDTTVSSADTSAVPFSCLYGRVIGGLALDLLYDHSSCPSLEGGISGGKRDFFEIGMDGHFPLESEGWWHRNYQLAFQPRRNLKFTGFGWQSDDHRSMTIDAVYLSKGGEIRMSPEELNFFYYRIIDYFPGYDVPFLGRGQLEIDGYLFSSLSRWSTRVDDHIYTTSENENLYFRLPFSIGLPGNWQLEMATYGSYASTFDSTYSDTATSQDSTSECSSAENTVSLDLRKLLNRNYLFSLDCSADIVELSTHPYINVSLDYLSDNNELTVNRVLADYDDYYGHLLGEKQLKAGTSLLYRGMAENHSGYLDLREEIGFGLSDYLTLASNFSVWKTIRLRESGRLRRRVRLCSDSAEPYAHSLGAGCWLLYLEFHNYKYMNNSSNPVEWAAISDFDYLYSPLLHRRNFRVSLELWHPAFFVRRWTNSCEDLLDMGSDNGFHASKDFQHMRLNGACGIIDGLQLDIEAQCQFSDIWNPSATVGLKYQVLRNVRISATCDMRYCWSVELEAMW